MLNSLLVLCLLMFAFAAQALTVDTPLPDAAQETRAKALFHDIRCVVCQGEAIADSPAEIASDMRRTIREHIATGETDQAIKSWLASSYGDVILMQPPLKNTTWPLWFGPLAILTIAGFLAANYFRQGSKA